MWLIILLRLGYLVMVCPLTFSSKIFQCILSIVVDTACFIQQYDATHSTHLDFQQASTFNIMSSYDMILRVDPEYHIGHIIVTSCEREYNIFKQQPTAHPVTQWLLEELTEKEHSKVQERFIINCLFGFVRVLFYFPIIVFMPRSM